MTALETFPSSAPTRFWQTPSLWRHPWILALLVAVLSISLTLFSASQIHTLTQARDETELAEQAKDIARSLENHVATHIATLNSGAALFTTVPYVQRSLFKRFALALKMGNESGAKRPGFEAIGWSIRTSPGTASSVATLQRDQGRSHFEVWPPPGEGEDVHAVVYLEPEKGGNPLALGLNMYADPIRRQAMDAARNSGKPSATSRLTTLPGQKPGFIVYVPVYTRDTEAMTPSQRARYLKGFIYSIFPLTALVESILDAHLSRGLTLTLYDGTPSTASRLYHSGNTPPHTSPSIQETVTIADRHWTLVVTAATRPTPLRQDDPQWLALILGSTIGALLTLLTWTLVKRGREVSMELQKREEEEIIRNVLARELTHRVKNTLATVLALATLTKRSAPNVESYVSAFSARLRALSNAYDLLTANEWTATPLTAVLKAELSPYQIAPEERVLFVGPEVSLAPNIALSFGLAIHELATNAAKYGALSVPDGQVSIQWTLSEKGQHITLRWQESNGPPVLPPTRRGFGSDLIERLMARELKTKVHIDYRPEGVICIMTIPITAPPAPRASENEALLQGMLATMPR